MLITIKVDYAVCGAKQETTRYESFYALKSVKGRCYYRIDFVCDTRSSPNGVSKAGRIKWVNI